MGIGRRLKEARERAGLTQEELGKLIGVTGSAITNYEKETSHPKEPVMYALFEALNVDPNYLFQDCVNIKDIKKTSYTKQSASEEKEIELYNTLCNALISLGVIGRDEDITEKQADILISVVRIIHASFHQKQK